MRYAILDCYTDEPSGLGVPPYLGTYPRYTAGKLLQEGHDVSYLRIDDLRPKHASHKTDIRTLNRTREDADSIIRNSDALIVIAGAHVPGKYLSAVPATLHEVGNLIGGYKCRKILSGPAATHFGTRLEGGKKPERLDASIFDEMMPELPSSYDEIAECAIAGASIVRQIPHELMAEIETARGCRRKQGCSFCTEPLKHRLEYRDVQDILAESKALHGMGVRHFRLGKQADFFGWSASDMRTILGGIKGLGVKTLHIDNVDPASVTEEKVKIVTELCTPGNVAALGIESFDPAVIEANNLNSGVEASFDAIRIINRIGGTRRENGMHSFLPGVNILFGLNKETKKTHLQNMEALHRIYDEGLLLRRINVRQVAVFPGTSLSDECGDKYLRKNRGLYWKWRNCIRQEIDNPMLARLVPLGTVLRGVRTEIHDGNTTFGRQWGTYPLIVGIKGKLPLGIETDVKVVGHMLRSIVGELA
jgi:radical SAM superfamily enzyme with C-terminal helix-hairpin-helix motif